MIRIIDKYNCCGCNACGDICPNQAISFKNDNEGFWYPEVDMQKCIDCGLCEKICPCLNEKEAKQPISAYAVVNPDEEIRRKSSSGGVFWLLVEQIIANEGVVFGAAFDKDWMVYHSSAVSLEEAKKFRGSKYLQSRMNGSYKEAQIALKQGCKVLFSGTACQIAGLKEYLKKDYDNLVTVDVVCHGVPSPGIWRDYLSYIGKGKKIKDINFRDKTSGWRNYDFFAEFADGSEIRESHIINLYMQGFLHDLYLRPSCHNCKFKRGKCGSDITIGDFWGIEKVRQDLDDNQGTSVVLANTLQGEKMLKMISNVLIEVDFQKAVAGNPCIIQTTSASEIRNVFMEKYQNGCGFNAVSDALKSMRPSLLKRIWCRLRRVMHH